MNKQNISKYLKQLRIESGLNRSEAASSIGTIYKSILDWESGVMPSNESLLKLAMLYKVKVDDILECGHKITEEELYNRYTIFKPYDYTVPFEKKKDIYTPFQEGLLIINKRLKELIFKYRKGLLTRSEDYELRFLFEKMCVFSDYYLEQKPQNKNKDRYLCFLEILNEAKSNTKTSNAYYFEVKKCIDIDEKYRVVYPYPQYGEPDADTYKDQQFKNLEPWEKDFYLALFQNSDIIIDPSDSVSTLEDYERQHGYPFDKDKCIKKLLRYYIENGAELNPWLLSFISKNKKETNILNQLENEYLDYLKPIFIEYYDKEGNKYCGLVENNEESRFLSNYESHLRSYIFEKTDPHKIIELINSDEKTVVDYFVSKSNSPYKGKEYRFKKASVDWYLKEFYRMKKEYEEIKEKEKTDIEKIEMLEEKLKEGQEIYYEYELEDIASNKAFNHMEEMKEWKNILSYSEYMKKRDKERTKELLDELDILSLEDIRKKYFGKEVLSRDE